MEIFEDPAGTLASELAAGERLLWAGRPRQGIFLRASDALLIPFSLLWGGFAIFWEAMALAAVASEKTHGAPQAFLWVFPIFGLPFVAIGLYLIFGRFFLDKRLRKKTTYGVTDQRVIIRSGLFNSTTNSLNLRALSDVSLSEGSDGRGTITFGQGNPAASRFGGAAWPGTNRQSAPSFDSIDEARRIYEIIRSAQTQASKPA